MKKLFVLIILFLCHTVFGSDQLISNHFDFEQAIDSSSLFFSSEPACQQLASSLPIDKSAKKPWTFIIYIAGDNDLRAFVTNNLKQMANIGSNEYINIVAHLDIKINGNQKITRRYLIEKNRLVHMNANDPSTQCMDSGDPKTLISCCEWAITNYPAHNYALILWNHGSGILDPKNSKIINPAELFMFNPITNKLDLDRSIGFLELMYYMDIDDRGMCWDSTTGNYLTNKKMESALTEICARFLHGKKFNIIGFDACLMSMLEVAHMMKRYAHVMVGSQEVELGTGWNYTAALSPFANGTLDALAFGNHIVTAYRNTYHSLTNDYTQSALNLDILQPLEDNFNKVATLLIECLKNQKKNTVKDAIRSSRDRKTITQFDVQSYIDMGHFYTLLLGNINKFSLQSNTRLVAELKAALEEGKSLIKHVAYANLVGKNLKNAEGISIYFPESRIDASYPQTTFAQQNAWLTFLNLYLK